MVDEAFFDNVITRIRVIFCGWLVLFRLVEAKLFRTVAILACELADSIEIDVPLIKGYDVRDVAIAFVW